MVDTVVLYPSPERGHIFSMVELGKHITQHHPSISVTIIILDLPNQTISTNSYISTVSAATPSIKFIHLPAVSPPPFTGPPSFRDIVASFYELPKVNNPNLHNALLNLSKSTNLKAFVLDIFCNYAVEVSSSLNIPTYYFFTSGANGLCHFLYWPVIHNSFKQLDLTVGVPGIPNVPSKDMPPVMLDRSHKVYQYFLDTAYQLGKCTGLILNSFESLEPRAIKAIVEGKCAPDGKAPPLYCIGPIVSTSDVKEENDCLTWLNSQPRRSVVFLSFGSMGVFSRSQLQEMAIGLEKSEVRFLWVVRDPPADSETKGAILSPTDEPNVETLLPQGFLERTKHRGMVVKSWAPQVAVLNHESVGGFVTHCGWNSILESVCAGVPMLAWPLYSEQKMNRVFLVEELKLALPVTESENGIVSSAELGQKLTELMNSDRGKTIRKRVVELKEAASVALSNEGSSRVNLSKLVDSFNVGPGGRSNILK